VPSPPSDRSREARDEDLEQIIYRLLEKPLTSRIESASELIEMLRQLPHISLPTSEPSSATSRVMGNQTHHRRAELQIRRSWILFWILALFIVAPMGLLRGGTMLVGVLVFHRGQSKAGWPMRWALTTAALALIASAWAFGFLPGLPDILRSPLDLLKERLPEFAESLVNLASTLYLLVVAPIAAYFFAVARRNRRDLALRELLRQSSTDPDKYLHVLKSLSNLHSRDTHIQQKYVEGLVSRGRLSEAAVEAQLIIENDPYNFGAHLLLAHAYFELGCTAQCSVVCTRYLEVSGYCFEFDELRSRCLSSAGGNQ
jgi:hypothetical protein